MVWGFNAFTGSTFTTPLVSQDVNYLELRNAKYDEIKIDEYADMTQSVTIDKEQWSFYTILLGRFQNSLEAGNIENKGMPVEYLRLKRKKIDDLTWQTLKEFTYDKDIRLYELNDYYIENLTDYIYGVSPLTVGIEGNTTQSDVIEASFDGTFITDYSNNTFNNIRAYYDVTQDDIEHATTTNVYETLGSKYPIIVDSQADYIKSSLTFTLLTNNTLESNSGINLASEIKNRKNIVSIFKNKKAKLIRSHSGLFALVRLYNIKEKPNNNLSQQLFQLSFDFVEIADSQDMNNFKENGLGY